MDINTLNQLKSVFKLTPSSQLALVICRAYIENSEDENLQEFVSKAAGVLSDKDKLETAEELFAQDEFKCCLELLDAECEEHLDLLLSCLLKSDQRIKARNIYHHSLNSGMKDRSLEIKKMLGVNDEETTEKNTGKKKRRLKVVEKAEIAEITDLFKYQQKVTDFSDVVGLENIKKQINKKIILPFQKPSLFQRFKKKIGGGVMLYGPPGCGKTLLARATAGECNATFYNVELSDIIDMYIGESEQKLHAIFEKARSETPCVLFFDEFEAMAAKRESSRNSSFNNLVSQFLTELDGFSQNNSGVLVLASTNVPWSIDSAFLRPGRFDRMFFVPPPDKKARQGILQHHMQERPAENNINYPALAAKCKGFSGADLFNLVEMAADEAIDESLAADTEQEVLISQKHFNEALHESSSTTIEWLTTARNYARYANDGGRYNDVLKFIQKYGK